MSIEQISFSGWRPMWDEKNRDFLVADKYQLSERNNVWPFLINPKTNQGGESCCVGCAFLHELLLFPAPVRYNAPNPMQSSSEALRIAREVIYWGAQKRDNFPGGEYPGANPVSKGTALLPAAKLLMELGYYTNYYWAQDYYDLALGVGSVGPAILGTMWRTGMLTPDKKGVITASGSPVGGHAVCVRGVNFKKKTFLIQNSWGYGWGIAGCAFISFDDMKLLLNKGSGEALFPVRNHKLLTI